jgi:hypothetical protein
MTLQLSADAIVYIGWSLFGVGFLAALTFLVAKGIEKA